MHRNGELVSNTETRSEIKCKSALDETETKKYVVTGGQVPPIEGMKRKDSGLTPKTSYSQILLASQSAYKRVEKNRGDTSDKSQTIRYQDTNQT